jgi:hypothetical protein
VISRGDEVDDDVHDVDVPYVFGPGEDANGVVDVDAEAMTCSNVFGGAPSGCGERMSDGGVEAAQKTSLKWCTTMSRR